MLPPFLGTPEKLKLYKKKLEKMALCNFIDDEAEKTVEWSKYFLKFKLFLISKNEKYEE